MRVRSVTAYVVRIPLRRKIRHASHVRIETDNIVVRCELSNHTVGWGEGVPREYVTGESADGAVEALKRFDMAPLTGDHRDFDSALAEIERLRFPTDDPRGIAGNAARCALELALLDAWGHAFGENLNGVTKLLAPELYEPRDRVQYSAAIASATGLKLRAAVLGMRLYGFRQLKVKVGVPGQDDVKKMRAVRRYAGSMSIRIDANEAWNLSTAIDRFKLLEPLDIESVEQPLPHESVAECKTLRQSTNIPVMLDESLCGMFDAEQAVADQWCDRFNLRLSKCGGYIPTLRLAQFAAQHAIPCQLGCQVGETAILSAAGRQFAASVNGLTAIEGSFDRHLVAEALSWDDITFGRGGWAPALSGGGHGGDIDPVAVDRVAIRTEPIFEGR